MKNGLLKKYIYPVLLTLLVVVLGFANYTPGTWLSGWDTLHPEFDFPLAIDRALSVWQGHQGLGAAPSQAQATELVRIPILWAMSLVVPISFVRYGFMFLTWWVGILGMYLFVQDVLGKKSFKAKSAAFIAALFYLLNLATVQQYIVPLSMFAVHFAGLPWLLMYVGRFLRGGGKKNIFIYAILSLLFSPMGHTPILFYVYIVSLILFGIGFVFKKGRVGVSRLVKLILVSLLMNSYWMLPNIYFLITHGSEVVNSTIHSNFSGEARLQSELFGTPDNLLQLKNFLFNWRGYDFSSEKFTDLMGPFVSFVKNPEVIFANIFMFSLAIIGLMILLFSGSSYGLGLGLIFLMGVFFWMNNNPPFDQIYSWLSNHISLFREGFRFPFTKLSLVLVMTMSVFVGRSMDFILKKMNKLISFGLIAGVSALILFSVRPVFDGWFIHPSMRVEIPNSYFQMYEWFGNQSDGRVLKLPMQSMYGWNFYDWGYQGAGFTWFGIPQATLDREFDRWNELNEIAYRQLIGSYYREDWDEFEMLLDKYNISYILWDDSVFVPGASESIVLKDSFSKYIEYSDETSNAWNDDFLTVYSHDLHNDNDFQLNSLNPFADLNSKLRPDISIKDDVVILNADISLQEESKLVFDKYFDESVSVFVTRMPDEKGMLVRLERMSPGVYLNEEMVVLEKNQSTSVHIPESSYVQIGENTLFFEDKGRVGEEYVGEALLSEADVVNIGWGNEVSNENEKTHIYIESQKEVLLPHDNFDKKTVLLKPGEYDLKIVFPFEDSVSEMDNNFTDDNCSFDDVGSVEGRGFFGGFGMQANNGGVYCGGLSLSRLSDYMIVLKGDNSSGRSVKSYVTDVSTGFSLKEHLMDEGDFNEGFYVSSGSDDMWLGFESRSFGEIASINRLDSLAILSVDGDWLSSIKMGSSSSQSSDVTHKAEDIAYDSGWVGVDGGLLKKIKMDEWANGFVIPEKASDSKLFVFYWPQVLEWGGLVLLALTPIVILKKRSVDL